MLNNRYFKNYDDALNQAQEQANKERTDITICLDPALSEEAKDLYYLEYPDDVEVDEITVQLVTPKEDDE
jgi:enolase